MANELLSVVGLAGGARSLWLYVMLLLDFKIEEIVGGPLGFDELGVWPEREAEEYF